MTISFNVQNARAGGIVATLNESRVDRILTAQTLGEAQRMGLFDRFKDWCRGGVKADTIRQIYDQISAPQAHESQPIGMLHRFERLRSLVTDEHRAAFSVTHTDPIEGAPGHWGFSLSIGETQVYHSGALTNQPGQISDDFKQRRLAYEGLNKAISFFKENVARQGERVRDPQHFIAGRVDCMSDQADVVEHIEANLQNPLYSKANFVGFEDVVPGVSFHAVFKEGDGQPVRLLLSDRPSTKGEFRADTLRDALRGERYQNLQELLSRGHLTDQDANASAIVRSGYFDLYQSLSDLADPEGSDPSKKQVFEFIRDLQPVNNPWFEIMRSMRFGDVTMMDAFFPDSKAEAEDLVRFDAARTRLAKSDLAEGIKGATHTANNFPALNRTVDAYVLENLQDLVDDAGDRAKLAKILDDPVFCAENFDYIVSGVPGKTFEAHFEWEDENGALQTRTLELSDRNPSNGEYRGQRVKDILNQRNFANLRQVFSDGYQGSGDAVLLSVANSTVIAFLAKDLGLGDAHKIPRFLMHLRDHGPADLADRTFDVLREAKIKNTNALELIMGDQAPPPRVQGSAPPVFA